LSGALYQLGGVTACLEGTVAFAAAAALLSTLLPKHASFGDELRLQKQEARDD